MGQEGAGVMDEETVEYLRALPYERYLESKHWREDVRPAALERANRRCQLCNTDKRLHVHHNNYDRLGAELPSDVVVLCNECHWRQHAPQVHTTHTGIVCPSCGSEFHLEVAVLPGVTG